MSEGPTRAPLLRPLHLVGSIGAAPGSLRLDRRLTAGDQSLPDIWVWTVEGGRTCLKLKVEELGMDV